MTSTNENYGSPPMSREQFINARLRELGDYCLRISCFEGCSKLSMLALKLVAARHGENVCLRDVLARLRCTACGRSPAKVSILDALIDEPGGPFGRVATWRVALLS